MKVHNTTFTNSHTGTIITVLLLLFLGSEGTSVSYAHGGVSDEPTPVAVTTSGDQLSVATYPGAFEVLLRYPAPKLGQPTTMKLFISEWASNKPMNASSISVEFPGNANAIVSTPLTRVADGSYQAQITFGKDDSYSALLKFTIGGDEQVAVISPIYAGALALQHLSPNVAVPPASGSLSVLQVLLGIVVLFIIAAIVRQLIIRRKRINSSRFAQRKDIQEETK